MVTISLLILSWSWIMGGMFILIYQFIMVTLISSFSLVLLNIFLCQAIWSAWVEWLWEVYTPYGYRMQRTPNSWTHGYLSSLTGDWSFGHVFSGGCYQLWWGKAEIGERGWNFSSSGALVALQYACSLFLNFCSLKEQRHLM